MGVAIGIGAALTATLMFGTNFIPVRRFEVHDGAMFQYTMCSGLLGFGLFARFALGGGNVLNGGLLGGAILATQNFLVIPVIKLLGLGVGFSLYHVVNLVVGFVVGRFGLFGMPRDEPARPLLQDLSILLFVLSFIFMARVEPDMPDALTRKMGERVGTDDEHGENTAENRYDSSTDEDRERRTFGVCTSAPAASGRAPVSADSEIAMSPMSPNIEVGLVSGSESGALRKPLPAISRAHSIAVAPAAAREPGAEPAHRCTGSTGCSWWARLERGRRKRRLTPWSADVERKSLGVLVAIAAGATCGVNAVPFTIWNATRPADVSPLTFVFSQCIGAYTASTLFYVTAQLVALLRGTRVKHSAVKPAYVSGLMWGLGLAAQLVAIEELGMVKAYVICAIGPVMVSALISALVFREIRGRRNNIEFVIALGLQTTGVLLLAVGS